MGIVFAMGFQSCLDDDNDNWYGKVIPNALVTVKTWMMVRFFLQLDDSTTLLPINVASSPFFGEKEVRALVNYDEVDEVSGRYSIWSSEFGYVGCDKEGGERFLTNCR